MRPHTLARLLCLGLLLTITATVSAAPPKEERTLIESGSTAFYSPDGKWLAYKPDYLKLGVMPALPPGPPVFDALPHDHPAPRRGTSELVRDTFILRPQIECARLK